MVRPLVVLRFCVCLLLAGEAFAAETDQFTTPRAPLRDFGPELSRKVVEIVESDRSGDDPARVLSRWAGRGLFASQFTRRLDTGYRPSLFGSIYRVAFSPIPGSFLFNSRTVNIHGHYVGTDKIDHFFRQGHEYLEVASTKGVAAAVARGVRQEHTYLGTLATGVYSNADLAANYAGMKFYMSLPQLFERTGEGWRLRAGADGDRLLEPFFSDHFDESLNPSRYRFNRGAIRSAIRRRCDEWAQFYAGRHPVTSTWHGEDYGHWLPPAEEVSISTVCDATIPA